jgi:hypothetical protein
MIYVYFSCASDERILTLSVNRLKELDPNAIIYVANDQHDRAAVPCGCHEALTQYDRGGTGIGLSAVEGELLTMQHILAKEHAEYITKIDSDVWLNSTQFLTPSDDTDADFFGIETSRMLLPAGIVYRLSRRGINAALEFFYSRLAHNEWSPFAHYAENFTIFHILSLVPSTNVELIPFARGIAAGFHDGKTHFFDSTVIHCGEPLPGGQRVSRAHVLTRMEQIKNSIKKI